MLQKPKERGGTDYSLGLRSLEICKGCYVIGLSCHHLNLFFIFYSGVNNRDKSGKTPLHTAILSKQFKIVDRLLECGADVTIKDDAGDTALHTAIRVGSERLVLVSISAHVQSSHIDF